MPSPSTTPSTPTGIVTTSLASPSVSDSDSDWTRHLQPVVIQPFVSEVGPSLSVPEKPIDIFKLFFTDDIMDLIVKESNR